MKLIFLNKVKSDLLKQKSSELNASKFKERMSDQIYICQKISQSKVPSKRKSNYSEMIFFSKAIYMSSRRAEINLTGTAGKKGNWNKNIHLGQISL